MAFYGRDSFPITSIKLLMVDQQNERNILKEHRDKISKMIKKDRVEIMDMFNSMVATMQHQAPSSSNDIYLCIYTYHL